MPGARLASGDRVTLRTEEAEDVPFLQRARANPELRHPIGNPVTNQEQMGVPDERPSEDAFVVCLDDESAGPRQPDPDETERIGRVGEGAGGLDAGEREGAREPLLAVDLGEVVCVDGVRGGDGDPASGSAASSVVSSRPRCDPSGAM
jgi:hypothetical protein